MGETKDRMLEAALRLFARDGYEAVSTSAIAGELGMTKGALYRHFPDKRAIFDSLVDEMLERHRAAGAVAGLAVGATEDAADAYSAMAPGDMADLGEALFRYWTQDGSAVAFRRMLSLERFRDDRIARVYDELFVNGPLNHHRELFARMAEAGALSQGDAAQMAIGFWAPVYLLMQAVDCGMDVEEAVATARAHVLAFGNRYGRKQDA